MGLSRLFKKDRSKNKFFNVPKQVFDALSASLIFQVPCPGDPNACVYYLLLRSVKDYCEELGYSCIIKQGEFHINKGNQCTQRNKAFVHSIYEIVSLQMCMNDHGPVSGPLKGWESTPPKIKEQLVVIQQSLINYV